MVDDAGSQRSNNFFGRKIIPVEEIIVSANESLPSSTDIQIISFGKRLPIIA